MEHLAKTQLKEIEESLLDITKSMTRDEREEFWSEINSWTYEKYEETLLESELELQNYEE